MEVFETQYYAGRQVMDAAAIEILGEETVVTEVADYLMRDIPEGFGVVMCRVMPYTGFWTLYPENVEISFIFEKVPPR